MWHPVQGFVNVTVAAEEFCDVWDGCVYKNCNTQCYKLKSCYVNAEFWFFQRVWSPFKVKFGWASLQWCQLVWQMDSRCHHKNQHWELSWRHNQFLVVMLQKKPNQCLPNPDLWPTVMTVLVYMIKLCWHLLQYVHHLLHF